VAAGAGCIRDTEGVFMSGRVVSTESAAASIKMMEKIINGGLHDQITALDAEGKNLSQPEIWDGTLANQFRSEIWPSAHKALIEAQKALEELRTQIQLINQNIMTAGGNQ
jgi:uncharacterized protein YukE